MSRPKFSLALLRLVVLGLILCTATFVLLWMGPSQVAELLETVAASRWGAAGFFVVYVIAIVFLLPGTVGTLTTGALFGFAGGFPLAIAAQTVGAVLSFIVARTFGRKGCQELLNGRLTPLDHWFGQRDFLTILILRMVPVMPFNVLNYGSGLGSIRLSRYVPATVLGLLPGTAVTTLAASRAKDPTDPVFIVAAVLLAVSVAIGSWWARRLIKQRVGAEFATGEPVMSSR
jgi:uncharacterized membrane protein YdjX (TVP38/TMEM64 family)